MVQNEISCNFNEQEIFSKIYGGRGKCLHEEGLDSIPAKSSIKYLKLIK